MCSIGLEKFIFNPSVTLQFLLIFLLVMNFEFIKGLHNHQPPSYLIREIINSQKDCHVHIANPNEDGEVQIIGGMKKPITINSQCIGKYGFRLESVRGLNCVILLVVKFSTEVSSCNGLGITVNNFGDNFVLMRNEAYFRPHEEEHYYTLMSRSCSLLLVTSRTVNNVSEELSDIFFIHGFRFSRVTLVYYENGHQIHNHFQVYTLCRFCGNHGPLLVNIDVSKGKKPLEWLTVSPYLSEKVFYLTAHMTQVFEFTSRSLIQNQRGPWVASKPIPPQLLDSSPETKRLAECYTLLEIMKHLNATWRYFYDNDALVIKRGNRFSVMGFLYNKNLQKNRYFAQLSSLAESFPFQLDEITHSFLTCYHIPIIAFDFYLAPFQLELWVAFLSFSLILYFFLTFLIRSEFGATKFAGYSVFLFVLSTITDDSCGMPCLLRKAWKIRFLLAPWFLASVIFVNVYQGIAVSSLLSPFKKTSISLFEHLTTIHYTQKLIQKDCLWVTAIYFYSNKTDRIYETLKPKLRKNMFPRSIDREKDFNILSSMTLHEDRRFPLYYVSALKWGFMQKFWNWIVQNYVMSMVAKQVYGDVENGLRKDFEASRKIRNEEETLFNLFYPLHSDIPFELSYMANNLSFSTSTHQKRFTEMDDRYEYAIEQEITKCKRTAYVDISEDVDREYEFLKKKYPHIKFFKSTETILETKQFWSFPELFVGSKMLHGVKQMFENGIHSLLNRVLLLEITNRKFNKAKSQELRNKIVQNGPQAISLSDKVQYCFIIYLICLAA